MVLDNFGGEPHVMVNCVESLVKICIIFFT